MADEIDFAFVLTANLKRRFFQVSQAKVTLTVEGAEDPVTHQRMRDEVSDLFKATQTQVNNFINSRDTELSRLSAKQRKQNKAKLIQLGNQSIVRMLGEFKAAAQAELDTFCRKEREKAAKLEAAGAGGNETWRNIKWVFSVAWNGVSAIGELAESGAEIAGGNVAAIKPFYDAIKDVQQLVQDVIDTYASEEDVRKRVVAGMKTLRAKARIAKSDVDRLDGEVKLYEAKLLALEVKAKTLSKKIAAAVKVIPADDITAEARKHAEQALHENLEDVIKCNKAVDTAQKNLDKFKLKLGQAKASARSDPTYASVLSWANETYTKIKDFIDDLTFDPTDMKGVIDKLVEEFGNTRNVLEAPEED